MQDVQKLYPSMLRVRSWTKALKSLNWP